MNHFENLGQENGIKKEDIQRMSSLIFDEFLLRFRRRSSFCNAIYD